MTADVQYPQGAASLEAWASGIEEIAQAGADFRADVAEGTILQEHRTDGGDLIRERKNRSMLRAGQSALPERVPLWNLQTGRMAMVPPTIAQKRRMQGTKQFPASAFTLRDPHLPLPEPISEGCTVCNRRRQMYGRTDAERSPRPFYDIFQVEAHKQFFHPREWDTEQRRQQQDERIEDKEDMRSLIREIVMAVRPDVALGADADAAEEQITEEVERRSRRGRQPRNE